MFSTGEQIGLVGGPLHSNAPVVRLRERIGRFGPKSGSLRATRPPAGVDSGDLFACREHRPQVPCAGESAGRDLRAKPPGVICGRNRRA
jgi:hypothetical protein